MNRLRGEESVWTFEDLGLFLSSIIPCWLVSMFVLGLGRLFAPSAFTNNAVRTLVFQISIYVLLIGMLYMLVSWRHGQPFWRAMGWTLDFQGAWVILVFSPLLAVGLSALGVALHTPTIPTPVERLISNRASLVVVGIFATILGPLFEELLFRGFLLPMIQRSLGAWPAIIITAIPFALLHGSQNDWAWQPLVVVGLAGVIFGYVRYKTGSTAASTLLHAGYNLTLFLAYIFQRG